MISRNICLVVFMLALGACTQPTSIPQGTTSLVSGLTYPDTRMGEVTDTYFGESVKDPYRWLEDDRSAETSQWVLAQNRVTFNYLNQIPFRDQLRQKLETRWNYSKQSAPSVEGDYTYYYYNDGLQNHDVVYRTRDNSEPEVFLDPNAFSEDGTTSLADLQFSRDGSLAAYAISESGSDWRKIIVLDAESKQPIGKPLENVKFSDITWRGNEGFYFSTYDKPEGSELSAKTDQHKLYFHRVGDEYDELIFGGTDAQKHRYVGADITEDDRYLLISGANSTSGNDLYIRDLSAPGSTLTTIVGNFDSDTTLIGNRDETLLLMTNLDSPNQRVIQVSAKSPTPTHWQDLIPESDNVLSATVGGGYVFAEYMVDAVSKVIQYDYDGKLVRKINLPGLGTATSINGKKDAQTLYFKFTNYYTPSTIYQLDVSSGESSVYKASGAKFDSDGYESRQVFFTSKDGTRVPMMITHKKGLKLDGSNPTMLYGYGGFNISLTPRFSVTNSVWMSLGGILAVPNLRGGGEYGKQWHIAGTQLDKQNVFDDFIAAAEYLIEHNYTSKARLAIRGGSNGGLLVGVVMNQRPDLMQVALPAVGVMDMLRYHTFTAGAGWAYDYGTSDQSAEMFRYLKAYSPVHNIVKGTSYPATLVTTGDHDDRVVPAHSFKFAAELQAKQAASAPTLIRIETSAGHGAGTSVSKRIDQAADMFAFTLFNMGYKTLKH